MASRPVSRDRILRLLRAYATASKMIDIYRAMAEAAGKYKPQQEEESQRDLTIYYECPICQRKHEVYTEWEDKGPELEWPMRLYSEAAMKIEMRTWHPELVFDPDRLSFR